MSNKDYESIEHMREEYEKVEMSGEQLLKMKNKIREAKKAKEKKHKYVAIKYTSIVVAAVAVFTILPNTSKEVDYAMSNIPVVGKLVDSVTFRDYKYEDGRNNADIEVPKLVADTNAKGDKKENVKKSAKKINTEIKKITDKFVAEFKENLKNKEGYQEVIVKSEVLTTSDDYFTLKLICYQSAGSGYEEDHYYTIDLKTGKRLALKDVFKERTDYKTVISENIKKQMREQMKKDENVSYWLDDKDIPAANFKKISDKTSFYINKKGNVVICFNEGDVAPMYMGCVEFEIPNDIVKDIIK